MFIKTKWTQVMPCYSKTSGHAKLALKRKSARFVLHDTKAKYSIIERLFQVVCHGGKFD